MSLFLLLRALLPRSLREPFDEEMLQVFSAQLRGARLRGRREVVRLWMRTAAGMVSAAWHERREQRPRPIRGGSVFSFTDARYSVRRLAAAPAFAVAAIGTLAVCIGANLTIFAAVDSILLRPLPFPAADRLVTIYNTYPRARVMDDGASVANYYERRGRIAALESVSLYRNDAVIVGETGSTEREFVMRVSPDFFTTLGVAPMLGRAFADSETVPGGPPVVMLSEPYWRQQFAGDRGAVGRSVRINGSRFTIVGVLPRDFMFLSSKARLFLPLVSAPEDRRTARRHSGSSSQMVARLTAGVTLEEAQAQIDAHNDVMEQDNPQRGMMADAGFRSVVVPLQARHVAAVRPVLALLQAGALVLLAIGIVNVGNLFLVRASSRRRELAVRRAIGARTAHVAAAVLSETVLVSVLGAVLGIVIAQGGVVLLERLGAARLPLGSQIALRIGAVEAAAAAALVVGLLLGAATMLPHLRCQAAEALRAETRGGTAGRRAQRTRQLVLVAQIALSFVLLAGAALLISGLRALTQASPGFATERLLTGQVSLPWARYRTDATLTSFIDRLMGELQQVPGIQASGVATNVPLSGNAMKSAATVVGRPVKPGEPPRGVYSYAVAGDYFSAMQIALIEGRPLASTDVGTRARVCVVDQDFARRYWPTGGAVGQRLFLGGSEGPLEDAYTIVGVVAAVKQAALSEADRIGAVYYPYSDRFDRALYIVSRTTGSAELLGADVQRIVRQIDPELPVNNLRTMEARIADSLVGQRSPALFGAIFSFVALLLTALGTYGISSYTVAQRRREIGIRIALGARPGQVRRQILRTTCAVLAAGVVAGLGGSWVAGTMLQSMVGGMTGLTGIPQSAGMALLAAAAIVAAVCVLASAIPARRAARISPVEALAAE